MERGPTLWEQRGSSAGPTQTLLVHLVIATALAVPIVVTGGVYLTDLPNHMFRAQLVVDLVNGKPSTFFTFGPWLFPNMPIDAFAVATRWLVDPAGSVVILTCLACALFYLSIVYWRWRGGRSTGAATSLLIILVLYSQPLSFGFINYILGLGFMNVALARLEANESRPLSGFGVVQSALLGLIYLCSPFPVLLYFAYAFGLFVFDATRSARADRLALARRTVRLHLAPAAFVLALMMLSSPVPPGDAWTIWSLGKKLDAVLALGRMSNLPHEFLFAPAILLVIALNLWTGRFALDARGAAGLLALAGVFLLAPFAMLNAWFVDMRLPMAIVAILLALVREAPAPGRAATAARTLLAGLVAIRIASLPLAWLPATAFQEDYAQVAKRIEDGAAVILVYDGFTGQDSAVAILRAWWRALAAGEVAAPRLAGLAADFWHLHLNAFRGRDLYINGLFNNFLLRPKPDTPFRHVGAPITLERATGVLASEPYDYVLAHVDLAALSLPGKQLCLVQTSGTVRLYRLRPLREGEGAIGVPC